MTSFSRNKGVLASAPWKSLSQPLSFSIGQEKPILGLERHGDRFAHNAEGGTPAVR